MNFILRQIITLIIRLYRENNSINAKRISFLDRVLPLATMSEIQYLVFGVSSTDYHNQLYGRLQSLINRNVKETDDYILNNFPCVPLKINNHGITTYNTLSTYIRNAIHHPDSGLIFNDIELEKSIEILRHIIKSIH